MACTFAPFNVSRGVDDFACGVFDAPVNRLGLVPVLTPRGSCERSRAKFPAVHREPRIGVNRPFTALGRL